MQRRTRLAQVAVLATIAGLGTAACGSSSSSSASHSATSSAGPAAQAHPASGYVSSTFVNGSTLTHKVGATTRPVFGPDDITALGGHIFVGFQNGVGSKGEASPLGRDSTIVEFDRQGNKMAEWDVVGKNDGLGADPATNQIVATVNEDGNSSVYLISPSAGSPPVHYHYSGTLRHGGGTDSITVQGSSVLIAASAPDSKVKSAPAVYRVSFDPSTHMATLHPVFTDQAMAMPANSGQASSGKAKALALSDPDSSAIVPAVAARFAGDYMLDSQGDNEQIFTGSTSSATPSLSVLKLSASVDDTAWASDTSGAIYTTDNVSDVIHKITGPFVKGSELAAVTPCNDNNAPSTCPGPGYPQNYLGQINPQTGAITHLAVSGATTAPKGMLFMP